LQRARGTVLIVLGEVIGNQMINSNSIAMLMVGFPEDDARNMNMKMTGGIVAPAPLHYERIQDEIIGILLGISNDVFVG